MKQFLLITICILAHMGKSTADEVKDDHHSHHDMGEDHGNHISGEETVNSTPTPMKVEERSTTTPGKVEERTYDHTETPEAADQAEHKELQKSYQDVLKEIDEKYLDCDQNVLRLKNKISDAIKMHKHDNATGFIRELQDYKPLNTDPCKDSLQAKNNASFERLNWQIMVAVLLLGFGLNQNY